MKDIFKLVKANITTRQAAEYYGLNVQRNGMTLCPFHNDHAPSLKVDTRFYCFGSVSYTHLSWNEQNRILSVVFDGEVEEDALKVAKSVTRIK